MAFLVWKDEYAIGHHIVDQQHQHLVKLLNTTYDTYKYRVPETEFLLNEIFDELVEYTVYHFATEEELMIQKSYPEGLRVSHVEAHNDLRSAVLKYQEKIKNHDIEIQNEILDFLKQWLLQHIAVVDVDLAKYLDNKNE